MISVKSFGKRKYNFTIFQKSAILCSKIQRFSAQNSAVWHFEPSKTTEFWAENLCVLERNIADFWKIVKLYLRLPKDFAEKLQNVCRNPSRDFSKILRKMPIKKWGYMWHFEPSKTAEFWAENLCLLEHNIADFWKSVKLYLRFPKDFTEKLQNVCRNPSRDFSKILRKMPIKKCQNMWHFEPSKTA